MTYFDNIYSTGFSKIVVKFFLTLDAVVLLYLLMLLCFYFIFLLSHCPLSSVILVFGYCQVAVDNASPHAGSQRWFFSNNKK